MTTHLVKPGPVTGLSTRCGIELTKAKKKDMLGAEDGLDHVDCAGCLRDLIVEMRMREMGVESDANPADPTVAESAWLAGGDTGMSSKTIWSVMTGRLPRHADNWWEPSIPYDPSDFGRCHRLLEEFPAWRARLPEVADKYPEWKPLVEVWDELTALYEEEWASGQAPKLYARMKELRGV